MSNTALNRTVVALLTNQSGGSVAQGDVVIVDSANAAAFTTTTTGAYASGSVGVVLEPNGIASGATGIVAFGGYVPKVNLSGSASLADVFKTHTVAKQAVRHAAPLVAGDFGQVLGTGTSPAAFLFNQPAAAASGGSSTLAGDSDVTISSPAAGQHLAYNGSHWINANPGVLQLEYIAATDLASGVTVTASTWTDISANQNFTVDDANSTIMIAVSAGILIGANAAGCGTRVIVDSAGTPVTRSLGGAYCISGNQENPLKGSGPVFLTGLSAGTHTVKVQLNVETTQTSGLNCRPSTRPNWEPFSIRVFEIKR